MIRVGRISRALAIPDVRLGGLGLAPYDRQLHAEAQALFVGVYFGDDLDVILSHRGLAIVQFCGADARRIAWAAPSIQQKRARGRIRVLAPCTLVGTLAGEGIEVDVVHGVFVGDPAPFMPEPLGSRVHVYCPYDRREEYGIGLVTKVAAKLPNVGFYLGRWGDHPTPFPNAIALPAWTTDERVRCVYRDCFCGLRTVARDGFPGTPVEMALMGRPTAHVVDVGVPWVDVAPDVDALVVFVERAREREEPDLALAAAARAYVADRSFLDVDVFGSLTPA